MVTVHHAHDVVRAVDLFAGAGGASEGLRRALGVHPVLAINHDAHAIDMHAANHPSTEHRREDILQVDPRDVDGRVDLLWVSPSCTHFSRARGGKPRDQGIRSLADVVPEWARAKRPSTIMLENVPEFVTWGPLDNDGRPIRERAGEDFRSWLGRLRALGYEVEWRTLVACDYGAPTTRKRLYLIARCDGLPIVWPEPTHGPCRIPYRTAAECIDWSIPMTSIFDRRRPLAEATQRRIAEGLRRFVLQGRAAYLVQTGYGERPGQTPRALDLHAPLGTVVAGGAKRALVYAWLAKHYGGPNGKSTPGSSLREPMGTVTAQDHHGLCTATMGVPRAEVDAWMVRHGLPAGLVADIGMRMLQPRELAAAMGFPASYVLTGTQTQQIARIGNACCPDVVEALVRANVSAEVRRGGQLRLLEVG